MKRMTQILSLGLLLSASTFALAGNGHDRYDRDGYYDGHRHHARQHVRYKHHRKHSKHHRHGNRHARRHSHHGRYCHDWHPRGYVAPRMHYGYSDPGLVIVYQPRHGFYIGGGH